MKRGLYYVLICLVGLTAFSCNKQLEITPVDQIPDARFWSTERDLDGSVAGAYALLRKTLSESPRVSNAADLNGYHPRHYMYGDRRGLIFASVAQDPLRSTLDADLKQNRIRTVIGGTRQWDEILFNWASFYQIVEQCNLVIENAHRVADNQFITYTREMYVAEARFIRAFTYFYMVRVWGDVPLNTKSRTTEKLARTDMNTVLDFVETELKTAEADLLKDYAQSGRNAIRATKGTVHATLAHVLAWRHKDAEAVSYATKVIDGGVYRLLTVSPGSTADKVNYMNIWKGKSAEGIFEIEFDAASGEYGTNGSLANLTLFGGVYASRKEPLWGISYIKKNVAIDGTVSWVKTRVDDPRVFFPDTTKDLRYTTNFDKAINFNPGNTFVFRKYGFAVDPVQNLFEANIVIFRVADIMLLRAECNARLLNYGPARADLDAIRNRAGLEAWTGTDADLYLEIFRERTRELLGEGHYFYDLVRTGYITEQDPEIVSTKPDMTQADFDEGAWTWPVSNRAFTDNPNIQQLRYWQRY